MHSLADKPTSTHPSYQPANRIKLLLFTYSAVTRPHASGRNHTDMAPDAPSTNTQAQRLRTIIAHVANVQDHLDEIGNTLQDLFADDYHLTEPERMDNLESMDLQRAVEDVRQGLRSMNRIVRLHAAALITHNAKAPTPQRPHLATVPPHR